MSNSARRVRWNRSIFPVVVGRARRGEQMLDAVLPADPVEEHLHRRVVEPAGEDLAVVGQDLLRAPHGCATPAASPSQTGLGALPGHQPRRHAEPGVVIDPGQRLRRASRRRAGTRRPRPSATAPSARRAPTAASPPCAAGAGPARSPRPGPGSGRPPTPRAPAAPRAGQLDRDPPRPPIRMRPAHLQHPRLHLRRHLMRARRRPVRPVAKPLQALGLIPGQPAHASSACSPATAAATSLTVRPSAITARTA